MKTLSEAVSIYRVLIIDNLFISLLFIKLFSLLFIKEAYPVSKQTIRFLIIFSGVIGLFSILADTVSGEGNVWQSRATGPYAASYWLMLFFSCILPFTLLINKIKQKGIVIFIVALLMNSGWLFEKIVIIITSLHRDYLPSGWSLALPFTLLVTMLIRGLILAFLITAISIIVIKSSKTTRNNVNLLK